MGEGERKIYGLGSERGLATPSPDGQGRDNLCALPKTIMPFDSVDSLRHSWETAHHLETARRGVAERSYVVTGG